METLRAAHESWNKRDFAGDFQGDVTVQYLVVSAIDNPHSSFANLRHNALAECAHSLTEILPIRR